MSAAVDIEGDGGGGDNCDGVAPTPRKPGEAGDIVKRQGTSCKAPQAFLEHSIQSVVLWSVRSLYLDQAVPRGPLMQWLLQCLLGIKFTHAQLKVLLQETPGLRADPPSFKKFNFRAILEEVPAGFQGFLSEEDAAETVSDKLWKEVARCLAQGGWPKAEDVSHRHYVLASWLQDVSETLRQLPFGRLLSIVRASAQTMGLLGHRGGQFVPYARSEECERRINACTGQPTAVAPDEQYVKTWGELRESLQQVLAMQPEASMEVSKLKASFRAAFQKELSETVFGHRCLSKLLADENLADKFALETVLDSRYVLRLSKPPTQGRVTLSLEQQLQ